ncbi:hypothetical protein CK215_23655 [Mesorhizobium sp. WSM3864]|nr:hypothetical protein CK215_23655 [Mesorhizobium sp. WSM3864]
MSSSRAAGSALRHRRADASGRCDRFEAIAVDYDHEAAAKQAEAGRRPEWARAPRTGFIKIERSSSYLIERSYI